MQTLQPQRYSLSFNDDANANRERDLVVEGPLMVQWIIKLIPVDPLSYLLSQ